MGGKGVKKPKEVKPFWYDYEGEIPAEKPEAEDLRDGWRETIREHTRMAMGAARLAGKKVSGNVPYGWDDIGGGRLGPNELEQAVLGRIREMHEEGASFRGIAAHLKADGIPTKKGRPEWTAATIRGVLIRDGVMRAGGKRISGVIPYGYRFVGNGIDGKGLIEEVPEEQAAIRLMVTLRSEGLSLRKIASRLKADGIKRQNGSADWPSNVVLMILRRRERMSDGR